MRWRADGLRRARIDAKSFWAHSSLITWPGWVASAEVVEIPILIGV
jgi:hypothetical protein